jgi:hypothetical protein
MALRDDIRYIGQMIIRECGLGTFVPAQVAIGATSIRVINAEIFEPAGGQLIVEETDNLVTYTAVQDDVLTGIPASGIGSITAIVYPYTADAPSLLYLPELLTTDELEIFIDRYRRWAVLRVYPDATKKLWKSERGWLGEDWDMRDDDDASYGVVTPDDDDNETGEFSFSAARSERVLYVGAWLYNPWYSIADVLESLIRGERWNKYSSVGQLVKISKDAYEMAEIYRVRGDVLEGKQPRTVDRKKVNEIRGG